MDTIEEAYQFALQEEDKLNKRCEERKRGRSQVFQRGREISYEEKQNGSCNDFKLSWWN